MDFELELAEQLEEIRAAYGMHVPMSTAIDIEHEETPLEVGYQDQFSTTLWKNLWKTYQSAMKQSGGLIPYSDEMISSAVSVNSCSLI